VDPAKFAVMDSAYRVQPTANFAAISAVDQTSFGRTEIASAQNHAEITAVDLTNSAIPKLEPAETHAQVTVLSVEEPSAVKVVKSVLQPVNAPHAVITGSAETSAAKLTKFAMPEIAPAHKPEPVDRIAVDKTNSAISQPLLASTSAPNSNNADSTAVVRSKFASTAPANHALPTAVLATVSAALQTKFAKTDFAFALPETPSAKTDAVPRLNSVTRRHLNVSLHVQQTRPVAEPHAVPRTKFAEMEYVPALAQVVNHPVE